MVPSARAARRRIRLLRLLEPGSLTWPSMTVMGWTTSSSRVEAALQVDILDAGNGVRMCLIGMWRGEGRGKVMHGA